MSPLPAAPVPRAILGWFPMPVSYTHLLRILEKGRGNPLRGAFRGDTLQTAQERGEISAPLCLSLIHI